jgi:cyclic beta-1,2-glucan synthetase
LRQPVVITVLAGGYWLFAPFLGAVLFPFARTLISSADGTPPFFGRLRAAYRAPQPYVRGAVVGLGCAFAYSVDLAAADGGMRFLVAFAVGALAYTGVDLAFDARRVASGERTTLQTWRLYALGAVLGGFVAGALGWYFDTAQLNVVIAKFWAYADINYRLDGRKLGDFTTYPIFNKYGAVNLGEVAGGVRLFWAESVAGVINWSIAAPLFSVNYVLLSALLDRSLQPLRGLFSAKGVEGLVEQAVRVMRWGLWMSPIINTFLRQSPDPSWYNQDGAVRTVLASGADIAMSSADFRSFSLMIFLGLLAYDWLRILICRSLAAIAPTKPRGDFWVTARERARFRTGFAVSGPGRRCCSRSTSPVGQIGTRPGPAPRRFRTAAQCRGRSRRWRSLTPSRGRASSRRARSSFRDCARSALRRVLGSRARPSR